MMRVFAAVLLAALLTYLGAVFAHNRANPEVSVAELRAARESAAGWIMANQERLLSERNLYLWWMVQRSAAITGDKRLEALAARFWQYERSSSAPSPLLVLTDPLFRPQFGGLADALRADGRSYYSYLMVYGATCDPELGAMELVEEQLRPDFCLRNHPLSPACKTHQLIGIQLARSHHCQAPAQFNEVASALADDIERALTWDPRRVDVFLQRLLLLVDEGRAPALRHAWLRGALAAQAPDGGWADFQPLVPLTGGRSVGVTQKGIDIQAHKGNFHATAQALLLFSMLESQKRVQ